MKLSLFQENLRLVLKSQTWIWCSGSAATDENFPGIRSSGEGRFLPRRKAALSVLCFGDCVSVVIEWPAKQNRLLWNVPQNISMIEGGIDWIT